MTTDAAGPSAADFPGSFRWGVATSAYQIEGAAAQHGRTPSIWDTFCRVPGAVAGGDTGDVACDHYHRMPEDVALIAGLGVDTYRFSVSWPRVQPHGRGPANERGLDFYDRLVDALLSAGVDPWVTLYHWDLPQALEDAGGWPERDTAHRFADYAMLVFDRLHDRVTSWTTLNEPWCVANYGYADGVHAPGRRNREAAMHAVHHLLLAHGEAVTRMRAARADRAYGITLNLTPAVPRTPADREAARRADGFGIRMYLDPLLLGRYPEDVRADLEREGIEPPVRADDPEVIAAPLDVLGVNYYFTETVRSGAAPVREGATTALGWPITPAGLTDLLVRLHHDYPPVPIVITENGGAFAPGQDDHDRIGFLREHIRAVAAARARGVDVRGYFVWTLLDNFEWAHGYAPAFGLVSVDRATLRRTPKRSALWYRDFLKG
ncbi:GH1 family beta-glucosidase [Actinomadura namibiensis]|uniref:Beta-glucosidase n=1 Tax=Actinomadura namibiensis TaxID=182080 RepID=A0A7W3QK33_ACTNM|nr:GH1 family beta-glucosidase [Actinomadura namibiensis]MBA8949962.1 beta-glucosidase [Actinomadura namibiensis]